MSVGEAGAGGAASTRSVLSGRGPAALTLVGLSAICLVFAFLLFDSYNDARMNAERATDNIAALVEQDISRNLELYELSMRAVAEGVQSPVVMGLEDSLRDRILFDRSATAPGLGSLLALDATGHIFASSLPDIDRAIDLTDRDYFTVHRDANSDIGLYVSKPFESRLRRGDWSVALSKRLSRADGSFGGVVVGSISLSFFGSIFDKVAVGQHGTIALFKTDGTLLMRSPFVPLGAHANLPAPVLLRNVSLRPTGSFETVSPSDGIRRLFAYRKISGLPLVVNVGFGTQEIFAGWWRKVIVTGFSLAILCAFVIVLMQQLRAELTRRTHAEAALSALATTDSLTALANRRKFDQMLDIEWRRAERDASLLSLVMVDVDFFKPFNDAYGHQEGDRVLRAVARQVAASISRPADIGARYGGEEFVALLPHTDAVGAEKVAERIRTAVQGLGIVHSRSPHAVVTVSVGVASVKPRYVESPVALLAAADVALYDSKAKGRNRSSVAMVAIAAAAEAQAIRARGAPLEVVRSA